MKGSDSSNNTFLSNTAANDEGGSAVKIRRKRFLGISGGRLTGNTEDIFEHSFLERYTRETGLTIDHVLVRAPFRLPIPIYRESTSRRPWPVKPEAMWHPFFWLPRRLQWTESPHAKTSTDGTDSPLWGLALLEELQSSGPIHRCGQWWVPLHKYAGVDLVEEAFDNDDSSPMTGYGYDPAPMRLVRPATNEDRDLLKIYDPDDGTWLDIPYLVGVDLETPEGVERMVHWLAGHADDDLDAINLDDYLLADGRSNTWAYDVLLRNFERVDGWRSSRLSQYIEMTDIGRAKWIESGLTFVAKGTYKAVGLDPRRLIKSRIREITQLASVQADAEYRMTLQSFDGRVSDATTEEELKRISLGLHTFVRMLVLNASLVFGDLDEHSRLEELEMLAEMEDRYGIDTSSARAPLMDDEGGPM